MKKLLGLLGAALALVIILVANGVGNGLGRSVAQQYSTPNRGSLVEDTVSQLNRSLPVMVDNDTRLDKVSRGEGEVIVYHYTIVSAPNNEVPQAAFQQFEASLRTRVCSGSDMKKVFGAGVGAEYVYKANDQSPIGRVIFRPNYCTTNFTSVAPPAEVPNAAALPLSTPQFTASQPPQQQYAPLELVKEELRKIDNQFKLRAEAINRPSDEIIEASAALELLQADKLLSVYGITEQKAKLKTLSAAIEQRARNAEVLSLFEAKQFAHASKLNNFSPDVVSTFERLRGEAWHANEAFRASKARLFRAIEAVLSFTVGKNTAAGEDGKLIFQWPLLTAEYERLMLEVHAAEAESSFHQPSKNSASAMTLERLSH